MSECIHQPSEPIAVFCNTCRLYGVLIEAVACPKCDGEGLNVTVSKKLVECRACRGTGVASWTKEKE
jgi:DnaJ-class molecular chaperone